MNNSRKLRPFGTVLIHGAKVLATNIVRLGITMLIFGVPLVLVTSLLTTTSANNLLITSLVYIVKVFWITSVVLIATDEEDRIHDSAIEYAGRTVKTARSVFPTFVVLVLVNLIQSLTQIAMANFAPQNVGLVVIPFALLAAVFALRIVSVFVLHVSITRGCGVAEAVRASFKLARGAWERILIVLILTNVATLALALPFRFRFDAIDGGLSSPRFFLGVADGIIFLLIEMYLWITVTLMYKDLVAVPEEETAKDAEEGTENDG